MIPRMLVRSCWGIWLLMVQENRRLVWVGARLQMMAAMHRCQTTVCFTIETTPGLPTLVLVALSRIERGAEILVSYGRFYWYEK